VQLGLAVRPPVGHDHLEGPRLLVLAVGAAAAAVREMGRAVPGSPLGRVHPLEGDAVPLRLLLFLEALPTAEQRPHPHEAQHRRRDQGGRDEHGGEVPARVDARQPVEVLDGRRPAETFCGLNVAPQPRGVQHAGAGLARRRPANTCGVL